MQGGGECKGENENEQHKMASKRYLWTEITEVSLV